MFNIRCWNVVSLNSKLRYLYFSFVSRTSSKLHIFNILKADKAESCSPEDWYKYDGKTCGSCSALVEIKKHRTCDVFCTAQGLSCKDSWDDEEDEECSTSAKKRGCGHEWTKTSDAICECEIGKDLNYSILIKYVMHFISITVNVNININKCIVILIRCTCWRNIR